MSIRVYNTMSRAKEDLVPRDEGRISMYVCGPTVYNYIHIGNARTFLNFDMVRRYLEFSGYDVTFVQNITDVDDKIIIRANEEGSTAEEVATRYREAFEEDMASLGVKPPDIAPRATEHIAEMVEVIQELLEKGYAYVSYGDVYFDVSSFEGYAKLSGRELDEQQVTVQFSAEVDRKDDPWDFALWKEAKPGEPSWDSPWGPGRPGWHIECSTMSMKYLGPGFDVHGGGLDLVFPHHENEIAQAEAHSESRFVRYWMHSGMLNIDQEKMSKSLGNIKTLREVLADFDADTIRMLMLGTHYRSPLSFSDDSLSEAHASLERVRNCLFNLDDLAGRLCGGDDDAVPGKRDDALVQFLKEADLEFRESMDDDFNSAAALGVLFGAVREINTYVDRVAATEVPSAAAADVLATARRFLEEHCGALGLFQAPASSGAAEGAAGAPDVGGLVDLLERSGVEVTAPGEKTADELVELLLEARQAARAAKDFALADGIRDGLADLGVKVEDVKGGFRWRFER